MWKLVRKVTEGFSQLRLQGHKVRVNCAVLRGYIAGIREKSCTETNRNERGSEDEV